MTRLWALGAMGGLAMVLLAGNAGCYLDQLQAEQRANRVLQEDLSRAKTDLADAEGMNKQKDTTIDGLQKQLAAKDETVGSLSAENQSLRDSYKKAEEILAKMAGNVPSTTIIQGNALPAPLSNALSELAKQYPDVLDFDPKTGVVRWKADLLFPLGSDQLSDSSGVLEPLKKFAEIVNSDKANGFDVTVVGHTCNTPIKKAATLAEHKSNWHLSAHRSIAVMKMLGEQQVAMTRMGVMGYGEFRPIAENSTPAGKEKNRRVEIYLVPKESVQTVSQGVYETKDKSMAFVKPAELGSPAPAKVAAPGPTKSGKTAPKAKTTH